MAVYYTSALNTKTHGMDLCLLVDQKVNPTIKLTWKMK